MGASAIKRHKAPIDGLNILILFVFVAAVMGNVVGSFLADPVRTIELTMLAFAVFFSLLGTTALIFRRIGHGRALALGLMVSQRNMGLMLAATEWRVARHDVAVLRPLPIPDLSVAATAQTDCRKVERATGCVCCNRNRQRISRDHGPRSHLQIDGPA